jgi:hypothetical protein
MNTDDNTPVELTNIAPVELTAKLISSSDRKTASQMKRMAHSICRNLIAPAYINRAFNRFKRGFIYTDENDTIVGFGIWKIHHGMSKSTGETYKTMTILLICGLKQSLLFCNRLFPDIDAYCAEHGISNVYLEPANETLKYYYATYGFTYSNHLNQNLMGKSIPLKIGKRNKTRKVRRLNQVIQTNYSNLEEV